ncbi:hypothetical protein EZJ49_01035 [Bdellovibrio bacteriovorus]|uniref:hypothetical protein n=1 Tax=Bdellovibrio bacteriovorus TaxID=959 RepID=UPI0021CF48C1|nr:hypothetical protein [Bdellovibrio bacteriovorus]UXR64839.1 hypothetical protein EZJ49_01035 [Bdellovibrio bacteriovorus]
MASAAFLRSLEKGRILNAVVEEVTSATAALCNFQGELLLISNHTGRQLKKGDPIQLQVQSVHPLQFQIFSSGSPKFQRVV